MLVEHLMQLMEDGEFQTCMRLVEQQITRGRSQLAGLAKINLVILYPCSGPTWPAAALALRALFEPGARSDHHF